MTIEYNPHIPGISEGDYTTWTWKWTEDVPDGLAENYNIGFHIDDVNDRLIVKWLDSTIYGGLRFGVYDLSDMSSVFQSAADTDYMAGIDFWTYSAGNYYGQSRIADAGFSRSLQTYILLVRVDFITIEIWRSGATVLWSHDITPDAAGTDVRAGAVSSTGKYILIQTDDGKLILYEGS